MIQDALEPHTATSFLTRQEWAAYTAEDHEVWGMLYARRMRELGETGSRVFLRGAEAIGLGAAGVPDLAEVNARLSRLTGWQAMPVTGYIAARDFFGCLAQRRFPTTVTLRAKSQLEYLPEPDIFHDVFGHVPLHADPVFADFLQRFGQVAMELRAEASLEQMARLFWFTVEFGLVREEGRVKVYGSGLISSVGDAANALGPGCERRPFVLEEVLAQPFEIDCFQEVLFVVEDFTQLFAAVEEATRRLK